MTPPALYPADDDRGAGARLRRVSGDGPANQGPACLDFNLCWVIARDLRVGASRLAHCPACEVRYLVMDNSRTPPSCPLCALCAPLWHPWPAAADGGAADSHTGEC